MNRPPSATPEQAKCAARLNAAIRKATTVEEFHVIRDDIRDAYRACALTRRQLVSVVDRYTWRGRHMLKLDIERP